MGALKKLVWKDGEMVWASVKRRKARKNVGAHYDTNQERWARSEREKKLPPKQLTYHGQAAPALPREADLPPMPLPSYQPPRFATESLVEDKFLNIATQDARTLGARAGSTEPMDGDETTIIALTYWVELDYNQGNLSNDEYAYRKALALRGELW